jgi:hypothetical protein
MTNEVLAENLSMSATVPLTWKMHNGELKPELDLIGNSTSAP